MELEIIMLSEIGQTQKKHAFLLCAQSRLKQKDMNVNGGLFEKREGTTEKGGQEMIIGG
jgi:hypothetical protein